MRLVATSSLEPKMKLGKPISNEKGQVLLQSGVTLTTRMIQRLADMKITYVYIQDEESEGIEPGYPITDQTKYEAVKDITNTFGALMEENVLSKGFILDRLGKNFKQTVKNILFDIRNNKEAISLLSDAISHDRYTFHHSLNVAIYSLAMAKELKYSESEQVILGVGALLHDIGKTEIPNSILDKASKLDEKEMEIMKTHTEKGFNILRGCHEISSVSAHCAYQHHERVDGTGYPRGLAGNDIHRYARIISVADVFGAVTSNRVYSKAILPHEGMELLFAGTGTQFDVNKVRAFRKTIAIYPVGLTVLLNDGRRGIVENINQSNSERPIVRVIEENGQKVTKPYPVDLNKELTMTIVDTDTTIDGKNQQLADGFYYLRS